MAALWIATGDELARATREDDAWRVEIFLEGSGSQCLALDSREPGTVYAGSNGEGIWKSRDHGRSWSNLATALGQSHVFSLAISPADGALYAGTEPSMLFVSHDGGQSWDELDALRRLPSAPTWSFPPRPWT